MEAITVSELLKAVNGELIGEVRDETISFDHVDTDSRAIHAGGLFIPLVGERFDGHAFINTALENGGAGCLTVNDREKYFPGKFYVKVADTQKALSDLASWYKKRFDIPYIAITGSVGKTTTKDMITAVLREKYRVLKTEGNFNNEIGLPLTLLRLDSRFEICVLEMGTNHFGEIEYLSAIVEPDVAIITNIGDCHIEFFGDRKGILKGKSEIFNHMDHKRLAILNGDDELLLTLKDHLPCPAIWCGKQEQVDYRAVNIESDGESTSRCKIQTKTDQYDVEIPALGEHMVYPALMAAAVAEHFGLNKEEIRDGILHFAPTKMRMNILRRGDGITILNDAYNASPQSMRAAAEVLAKTSGEYKIAVLGDMFELGALAPVLHAGVGDYLGKVGIDCLVAVGELAHSIADAALKAGVPSVLWRADKTAAMTALAELIRPNSTILVKASRGMAFEEIVAFLQEKTPEPTGK
jgi:UDP-N-acetylmuramoyl-tripeptide--D-alanyl-D-alanine ligase